MKKEIKQIIIVSIVVILICILTKNWFNLIGIIIYPLGIYTSTVIAKAHELKDMKRFKDMVESK